MQLTNFFSIINSEKYATVWYMREGMWNLPMTSAFNLHPNAQVPVAILEGAKNAVQPYNSVELRVKKVCNE